MDSPEGKHRGYFEGVLQLRNASKKLKDYVKKEMEENRVYVAKTAKAKDGIDMWVSSNKFLLSIAKKLKANFNGDMKISRKIYSRDRMTQKDIWRITVFFKEVPFKINQKMMIKGDEYRIASLGKKVTCVDVKTGKKKFFDYEDLSA